MERFQLELVETQGGWPVSADALVERRLPWDGKKLGTSAQPPVEVACCFEPAAP